MKPERAQLVIDELKKKGAIRPCPRCDFPHFEAVAESYLPLAGTGFLFGDDKTPVILTACKRCGFLSTHGAGRLFQETPPAEDDQPAEGAAVGGIA